MMSGGYQTPPVSATDGWKKTRYFDSQAQAKTAAAAMTATPMYRIGTRLLCFGCGAGTMFGAELRSGIETDGLLINDEQ